MTSTSVRPRRSTRRAAATLAASFLVAGGLAVALPTAAQAIPDPCSTAGKTVVMGTLGKDTLKGNSADEVFLGLTGDDTINGGGGSDVIFGGPGKDTLNGGAGRDCLQGGLGNDTLNGGADDDILDGQAGDDTVDGGGGTNQCVLTDHVLSVKYIAGPLVIC